MTEDFALIDFALSARSPQEIAQAIGKVEMLQAKAGRGGGPTPAGSGFLSRMFRRGISSGGGALLIQPEGTLGPDPLIRADPTDLATPQPGTPVRLTGPVGFAGLTLIEFLEDDGASSAFCENLSAQLPGDELFYFRHSGSRHPGAHFAFHIYRDGRATRQAVSVSPYGTAPEADWTGVDSGMPHPLETDSLPPPGIPAFEIMTPARQASILEALELDPGVLFQSQSEDTVILELSSHPGGAPLTEAAAIVSHLKKRRSGAILKPVAPVPAPATPVPEAPPQPTPEPYLPETAPPPAPPVKESPTAIPVEIPQPLELPQDARIAAEPSEQMNTEPVSDPDPTPVSRPVPDDPPPASPAGPRARAPSKRGERDLSLPPWEDQRPAPSWEEEVTAILLEAVQAALPPPQQAAWLEMLTGHLNAGELDTALHETLTIIDAGNRSQTVKDTAARRLSDLFGRGA